jgi:hypothetical protein
MGDTVEFLKLLEHDLPDQVPCSACKKFHKIKHARRYMENNLRLRWRKPPACVSRDSDGLKGVCIHYNFSSVVFKMAMKLYHQNNPGRARLLELLSEKSKKTIDFNHIRQYAHQIRIVNGSMFIRQQLALHLSVFI